MLHRILSLAALVLLTPRPASPQQPAYDRHYLDSAEYFIASDSMTGAYQYVALGRLVTRPSPATRGEGEFLVVGAGPGFEVGRRVWTRHFWRTRAALPADAGLGAVVFCLNKEENGVYQGPANRDEALTTGWWMTTVTDVSDVHRQEVRAGDYRLSLACLRVGADAPAALVQAAPLSFDRHFLDTAEYFIARDAPSGAYSYVAVGRMIIGPTETSRGAAQFLVVGTGAGLTVGERVWTPHYWRTRPAVSTALAVGQRVFCLNAEESGAYRAPRERGEALNTGWWLTTITDVADLYRQQVRAGDYRLGVDCLRVAY